MLFLGEARRGEAEAEAEAEARRRRGEAAAAPRRARARGGAVAPARGGGKYLDLFAYQRRSFRNELVSKTGVWTSLYAHLEMSSV